MEVHIQHPLNLLIFRLVRQSARRCDARIVHCDVETSKGFRRFCDALSHLLGVADIELEGQHLDGWIELLEVGDGCVELDFVDVGDGETGDAMFGECYGCLSANSCAACGMLSPDLSSPL